MFMKKWKTILRKCELLLQLSRVSSKSCMCITVYFAIFHYFIDDCFILGSLLVHSAICLYHHLLPSTQDNETIYVLKVQ